MARQKKRAKANENGEISVKLIDPSSIDWNRYSRTKYLGLYKKIASLKIGQALEICNAKRGVIAGARYYCRKHVKGNYRIRSMTSKKRPGVFYILKTEK